MARQLTEQLEREVSAEELMKQTKSTASGNPNASPNPAPASFDTSYVPNDPPPVVVPPPAAAPPADAPAPVYSDAAATVHGADWHPSPTDHKPANE